MPYLLIALLTLYLLSQPLSAILTASTTHVVRVAAGVVNFKSAAAVALEV